MIGLKFGKWIVQKQVDKQPGKHFECKCECGNLRVIPATTLRANRSKQCSDCMYKMLYDPAKEIGKTYGKWKVLEYVDMHRKLMRFLVECKCGLRKMHVLADLRAGKSTQCTNCHNREVAKDNIKHGMHDTKLYKVWSAMHHRCNNPNATGYKWYGARGINVCKRWGSFENFLEDMGIPKEGLTLDRIDNDKGYSKENCRWVTHKENCQNRIKRK